RFATIIAACSWSADIGTQESGDMLKLVRWIVGPLAVAATLADCMFDFDHFAPTKGVGQDGGSPVGEDAQQTSQNDASELDALSPSQDGSHANGDASEGSTVSPCADAGIPPEASTSVCPATRPADGTPCDSAISNRSCKFARINCLCQACAWT